MDACEEVISFQFQVLLINLRVGTLRCVLKTVNENPNTQKLNTFLCTPLQMSSARAKSQEDSTAASSVPAPVASKTDDSMKTSKTNQRLSRSMTRRFLYFHNKTLSKIKLL